VSKITITPIGTCRVNTPLLRAQHKYPITVDLRRNYGFTHSSAEALQQLQYLLGEKSFGGQTRAAVFKPGGKRGFERQKWEPADLHLIEIASAKKISAFGDVLQQNYLSRHFGEFFSQTARAGRFWWLTRHAEPAALQEFLDGEPSYTALPPDDRALLSAVRFEIQTPEEIEADMTAIVERLGQERILFVTHVNALTPEGGVIGDRDRLIRAVKEIATKLCVPCFDPSEAMFEMGQNLALEGSGRDATHYTPAFSDRVYNEIHREFVAPRLKSSSAATGSVDLEDDIRQQLLADSISAMLEYDDFDVASKRLFDALREEPDALPLRELHARILARIGDYPRALEVFDALHKETELSRQGRLALLETRVALEQWQDALEIVEGLLGDEYETAEICALAARANEQLDNQAAALAYWKRAFRQAPGNVTAALRADALLADSRDPGAREAWRNEFVNLAEFNARKAYDMVRWAIEEQALELVPRLYAIILAENLGMAINLCSDLLKWRQLPAAAICLQQLAELDGLDRDEIIERDRLAGRAAEIAERQLEEGQYAIACGLADAASQIRGGRDARLVRRMAVAQFRNAVQAAYADQDYAAVAAQAELAPRLVFEISGLPLRWAVSLFKLEREPEALDVLIEANSREPHDLRIERWLARVAARQQRFEIALPHYRALRDSPSEAARKFAAEIERFFATAERRAMKQLRLAIDEGNFDLAMRLTDLLQREPVAGDRLDRLVTRLNSAMWKRLKAIEQQEKETAENAPANDTDGVAEREQLLNHLLRLNREHAGVLRRAALLMMSQDRFAEAAPMWEKLVRLEPALESPRNNLRRCRTMVIRQQKSDRKRQAA
jgi:tetratricopeptide (TPR) repeat protein